MLGSAILRYHDYRSDITYMDSLYITFTGYLVLFSYLLFMAECEYQPILTNIAFLKSNTGKGIFMLFAGILLLDARRINDMISCFILAMNGTVNLLFDCFCNKD